MGDHPWKTADVISTTLSLRSSHFASQQESNSSGDTGHEGAPDHEPATDSMFAAVDYLRHPHHGDPLRSSFSSLGHELFGSGVSAVFVNGDRRKKRMIKNRESAARSRARKQEK